MPDQNINSSPSQGKPQTQQPPYYGSGMWQLELALTAAVGGVLVAALLMCYIYVFRQLCCPPPRHGHARHRHRYKTGGYNENGEAGMMPMGRSTRMESLPMTNITSQPTETDRL